MYLNPGPIMGYHPQVILAGRRINNGMAAYIAQQTIEIIGSGFPIIKVRYSAGSYIQENY